MLSISVLTDENVNPLNNGSSTKDSTSTTLSISSSSVSTNSSSSNRCCGILNTIKTSDSLKRKRPLKIQLPSSVLREIQIEKVKNKDNMSVEDQQPLEYMGLGVGVFCKKGKKKVMEDTHKIFSGLNGNPKKVISRCFFCGENDHWKHDCSWNNYQCVRCKQHPMKLFVSGQENSKGDKFFRCSNQPICGGFEWFEEAKKKKKKEKEKKMKTEKEKIEEKPTTSTIKLRIDGTVPMTAEGNPDEMAALILKLQNM
ncbi:hypothetical protein AQUCO_01100484v1 [Aquilegia coerulea]|uniref:GRF-type domain-containing protein n=1 Tax=Aquilegia coerulea TaxID=218851 RepID=A0A2G5E7W4_AQUCA|nr:hypothetical protein AQUCO_01100484v1 [Aquilegia coerulea]